jgi:hypothetical protein
MLGQALDDVATLAKPWQRWMAAATPKVLRIARLSAFAPSTMNNRGSVGASPPPTRLSSKAWTTTVFSVAPSTTARTCLRAGKWRAAPNYQG